MVHIPYNSFSVYEYMHAVRCHVRNSEVQFDAASIASWRQYFIKWCIQIHCMWRSKWKHKFKTSTYRITHSHTYYYMSMARRRLKSPWSLSDTSTHPTMVALVHIMVMNGCLTSFAFQVNRSSHSGCKVISDSDLETHKVKVMVKGQGHTVGPVPY